METQKFAIMEKTQFFRSVEKEARNIKKFATEEEKQKLNFGRLAESQATQCYYGLMTGDCRQERAKKLMQQCCTVFFSNPATCIEGLSIAENGKERIKKRDYSFYVVFSSLETFGLIYSGNKEAAKIIAFIKGERKTLKIPNDLV